MEDQVREARGSPQFIGSEFDGLRNGIRPEQFGMRSARIRNGLMKKIPAAGI